MSCQDCFHAKNTCGIWRFYDNRKCVYYAARLIKHIPCTEGGRRRVILKESVAAGLSESVIRALVKGPTAFAPEKRS